MLTATELLLQQKVQQLENELSLFKPPNTKSLLEPIEFNMDVLPSSVIIPLHTSLEIKTMRNSIKVIVTSKEGFGFYLYQDHINQIDQCKLFDILIKMTIDKFVQELRRKNGP